MRFFMLANRFSPDSNGILFYCF